MKKLILIIILFVSISSLAKAELLPIASFTIPTTDSQDIDNVWNNLRACLLINGFIFSNNSGEDKKIYISKTNYNNQLIVTKNPKYKFVELVFINYAKPAAFGLEEEDTFNKLKATVQNSIKSHAIEDSIPFKRTSN